MSDREEDLFNEAREIPEAALREAFLEKACKGKPELKARVERLLRLESQATTFFEGVRKDFSLPDPEALLAASNGVGEVTLRDFETVGSRVGRYRLLSRLGEGGCGIVFLAEQEAPVKRRVALKIVRRGMETRSVIARFEVERQALALMDHRNIARVFDAGATENGLPYFVMELVQGVRITDYCDQKRLSLRQRLELFVQVCHAIQHAHQKGIIHRDIKPSNIMVCDEDGQPLPKVIDFGIAKAIEGHELDPYSSTNYAQLVGTPAYMSPEQAGMSRIDIDTRSDVYSLGAVLYELVCGRPPFDPSRLKTLGLDELRQELREKEPPAPSLRLGALTVAEGREAATARLTELGVLSSQLKGDLDWVVMKALEKDRARRYETANGFAMDVQRYLRDEPVMARPPTWLYQFQKLVRRNRTLFAAGSAVAAALIAGLGTSTWLLFREREARQRAVAAEQQQARLRQAAENREKVMQAALYLNQEKFIEADGVLQPLLHGDATLDAPAVLRSLGDWHAVNGRWPAARDYFMRLCRADVVEGPDMISLDLLRHGPALLEADDEAGYEAFRKDLAKEMADSPAYVSDRVLKVALLRPASPELLADLKSVFALSESSSLEAEQHGDGYRVAWRSLSLSLYWYRCGDYSKAVEQAKRCLSVGEIIPPRNATALTLLALSESRLGNTAAARAALAAAAEIFRVNAPAAGDRGSPQTGFWFDWQFGRLLFEEARRDLAQT